MSANEGWSPVSASGLMTPVVWHRAARVCLVYGLRTRYRAPGFGPEPRERAMTYLQAWCRQLPSPSFFFVPSPRSSSAKAFVFGQNESSFRKSDAPDPSSDPIRFREGAMELLPAIRVPQRKIFVASVFRLAAGRLAILLTFATWAAGALRYGLSACRFWRRQTAMVGVLVSVSLAIGTIPEKPRPLACSHGRSAAASA
jgi:hypothetical protein